ncbi:conserved hypothetical protein [Ignisphaera aggregans DSM 17230]|uniref:Uncharacterized protein n=1 Tax=Ignisphaera aggregans (strain DSM 17230 / JCM 13409 / AQ1.S1) TaxID=583356 RepID=E0ST05_IGNAA|nr:conserved hypothetical protein [Ignisphaera aggregans DSM 17230]
MLIDITTVISSLVAQLPLIAIAILILILYIERRLKPIESRIEEYSRSLNTLIDFNEVMLSIQISRGLITDAEYRALTVLLSSARPIYKSKYYTKEVYEKLGLLLKKSPDEITWDDVFELEKIYDLLLKEAIESKRDDLARYAGKLKALIAIAKGLLLRRGVLPPPKRDEQI